MKYGRYLTGYIYKSSLMNEKTRYANLGDNIQALAIDYIYQKLGIKQEDIAYVKRDETGTYDGEDVILPFFSEFARENIRQRMSFSNRIHIAAITSAVFYEGFDVLDEVVPNCERFFYSHQPIGCRDEKTRNYLRKCGLEAYLMGCFTICFPKRTCVPTTSKTFFIDVSDELKRFIPAHLLENAEFITHAEKILEYPMSDRENNRLDERAKTLLTQYRDEATLVVTGRLHAALPCLAMGIPVILASNNLDFRFEWVEKYLHPYQLDEYANIDWNPPVVDLEETKKVMLRYFSNILHGRDTRTELQWLDAFYDKREKIETYLTFRNILRREVRPAKANFRYALWGAGYHASYAYDLMSELFPKAVLSCVVDKYKTGKFHGVPIIRGEDLKPSELDHLLITTTPGTAEALAWRDRLARDKPYTLICSQQKS